MCVRCVWGCVWEVCVCVWECVGGVCVCGVCVYVCVCMCVCVCSVCVCGVCVYVCVCHSTLFSLNTLSPLTGAGVLSLDMGIITIDFNSIPMHLPT